MSFSELKLSESLLRAIREADYEVATPIQIAAIPPILAGHDCLACAQTGTGKTAAFALPALQRLVDRGAPQRMRVIRTLVLAPTRELASQIAESFRTYGRYTGLRHAVVFGGVSQHHQVKAIQHGVDILVATPGRLLDLMNQGFVDLRNVETLVLDEADQMLDMGFIHDLKRIVARVPRERQTLMFSATMQPEIRRLADQWLRNPTELSVAPQGTPVERVEQSVYFVERGNKPRLLAHYLGGEGVKRAIVFMRTKHGADKLVRGLLRDGIRAEAIHGNKSQNARQRALAQFKSQHPPVLVATDIAARGLDIDSVTHVINFDLPMSAEIYVHRIGRTARAGAAGVAVTFCDREERSMLRDIERLTRQRLTIAKHELATGSEAAGEFRTQNARPTGSNRRPGGSRPAGYAPNNGDKRGRRSNRPFNAGERTAGPTNRFKRRVAAV